MGADRPLRKRQNGSIDKLWEERTRQKIQAAGIVNRLIDCVNGKIELVPAQVSAGMGLLRKVLPDLTATEITAEVVHRFAQVPQVMSKEDWLRTRGDPRLLELKPAEPEKPKDPNSKLN